MQHLCRFAVTLLHPLWDILRHITAVPSMNLDHRYPKAGSCCWMKGGGLQESTMWWTEDRSQDKFIALSNYHVSGIGDRSKITNLRARTWPINAGRRPSTETCGYLAYQADLSVVFAIWNGTHFLFLLLRIVAQGGIGYQAQILLSYLHDISGSLVGGETHNGPPVISIKCELWA